MDNENTVIGKRIRGMREFQKLSRERLAESANISTQFLADIETGKKGMTVTTLKKICTALHTSADSIIFGSENECNFNIEAMMKTVPEDKKENFQNLLNMILKII